MFDKILALYWDFFLIPYYKVYVMKDNKVLKVFNQKAVNSLQGGKIGLVDTPNLLAWFITDDFITHKNRMIYFCEIDNAVPLKIIEKIEITGDIIQTEKTKKKIIIDKEKIKGKDIKKLGQPKTKTEIHYPPDLLFEALKAHFVELTISEPPSKWAELKWVLIVAIIGGAFLLWQLMTSGFKPLG